MQRIIFVMAPLVLAGCTSQPAEKAAEAEPAEIVEEVAMTTANGTPPGTFDVTLADGTVARSVLNADGTYKDFNADGTLQEEGAWNVTDGKTCFAPTTAGAKGSCSTDSAPGEDGSFTATMDDGTVVQVKPVAAE
jgi:hypothetical protein